MWIYRYLVKRKLFNLNRRKKLIHFNFITRCKIIVKNIIHYEREKMKNALLKIANLFRVFLRLVSKC